MKTIILTSGPQGAGKSSFVQKVRDYNPEVQIVSRDKLLMNLFGTTTFDVDTGGCPINIFPILYKQIKRFSSQKNSITIFDCWNGYPSERERMIQRFRTFGANRIVCWKFITPMETCRKWYLRREGKTFYSESNYRLYHKKSLYIEKEGFDFVQEINPLQYQMESLLRLK